MEAWAAFCASKPVSDLEKQVVTFAVSVNNPSARMDGMAARARVCHLTAARTGDIIGNDREDSRR